MQWKVVRFPEFHHVFLDKFVFCQALAEGLKENSTLTHLVLRGSTIGPRGAEAWCVVMVGTVGMGEGRYRSEDRDTAIGK